MGSFLTYHLAGGPGGMRDFIKQFDPSLALPWTDLNFPKWNEALEARLVEGCEAQAAGRSVAEIEAQRNDVLVEMMQLFKRHGVGAGRVLAREEAAAAARLAEGPPAQPLRLHRGTVLPAWVDYNGHMSDAFYLWSFGEAADAVLASVGAGPDYRASGKSFYTAETHVNYFKEMHQGDAMTFETELVGLDPKRLHFFHRMLNAAGEVVASNETMLLHVDTRRGAVVPMTGPVYEGLLAIRAGHERLPRPKDLGRVMKAGR
jgi:carnitine 3-dehydrogenase